MSVAGALPFCVRCQSPLEEGDLRCATCGLSTPVHVGGPARARARLLRCESCGAAMAYSAELGAPSCAFCSSVMRLEEPVNPVEHPEFYLPFTVPPERAVMSLAAWMKTRGWFRPADLASAATVDSLRPLWWCAWVFDAQAVVSWAADSDAGSGRSDWAPHSGQAELVFERILVPASRGLSDRECLALAPGFDLSSARAERPAGPASDRALLAAPVYEEFDVQRSAGRKIVLGAVEEAAASRIAQGYIPGSRFRNVKVSVLLKGLRTRRIAVPTYVLAYRYRKKLYRVLVQGHDEKRVLGDSPLSSLRVFLVVLLIAGGVAGIAALIAALAS